MDNKSMLINQVWLVTSDPLSPDRVSKIECSFLLPVLVAILVIAASINISLMVYYAYLVIYGYIYLVSYIRMFTN